MIQIPEGNYPGGCDYCDAIQEVVRDKELPGIVHINIRHDDDCPWFLEYETQRGGVDR